MASIATASLLSPPSLYVIAISNAWLTIAAFFVAYLVASVVYAVTLHPLAGIPGPKLCAVTRIPYWHECLKGNDVKWLESLHAKYGHVLRFGPTDVSYTSPQAWKDVHGFEKGKHEMEKAQEFSVQPVNGVPSMLTADFENHARVKKLFSPAFSDRALKRQEPLFKKYTDILLLKMRELEEGGKPLDVASLYNFATFDTMAELCFGHPLGLLAKNEFSPWVKSIFESLKMLPIVSMIAYYPILNAIFTRFEPKSVMEQRIVHCRHSEERVNQRLSEGSDQPDIWNLVMDAYGSNEGLTLEEMHSNAELFMLAGSETTATLLSGLTFFLLVSPDKMALLRKEVRDSARDLGDLTLDNLASLKYLNACIKEALRMYPPVPIGSPRVVPEGGKVILGRWIPAETRVSVHHWSTYHSEFNFHNPKKFVPERWLGVDPVYANDILDAVQPFGWGPRNCLGQNMAWHEMRLIMASVIYSYDFELAKESENWSEQQAFALWIKSPLLCRVKTVSS
ncbi:cytochrome P450 [Xylariales sp. PMI_506]|nr:cytochrome P450 [Xylariales sp. PMI_506]